MNTCYPVYYYDGFVVSSATLKEAEKLDLKMLIKRH